MSKITIHEHLGWVEYHHEDFPYYITIDKMESKSKAEDCCSDDFYDMNLMFLQEVLVDYSTNDYEQGRYLK